MVADRDVNSETVGGGQSLLFATKAGTASDAWVGSSTEAGAASVTMSWTTNGAGAGEWAAVAVSLKPVVNTPPTITNLSGDSLAYAEGDGAVVIEQGANALVADVDSTNLDTGTLTVSIPVGSDSAEDVLAIRNQGTGAGEIG